MVRVESLRWESKDSIASPPQTTEPIYRDDENAILKLTEIASNIFQALTERRLKIDYEWKVI